MNGTVNNFNPEVRAHVVRMVLDHESELAVDGGLFMQISFTIPAVRGPNSAF